MDKFGARHDVCVIPYVDMTFAQLKVSTWRRLLLSRAILTVRLRLFHLGERFAAPTTVVAYVIVVIVIRE